MEGVLLYTVQTAVDYRYLFNICFHLWNTIYTNILSPIQSQLCDNQIQCSNGLPQQNKWPHYRIQQNIIFSSMTYILGSQ